DDRLKRHVELLKEHFADKADIQYRERQLTEDIAVALQARLLLDAGNTAVSDAFMASRLAGCGRAFGTLPGGLDVRGLIDRSMPVGAWCVFGLRCWAGLGAGLGAAAG